METLRDKNIFVSKSIYISKLFGEGGINSSVSGNLFKSTFTFFGEVNHNILKGMYKHPKLAREPFTLLWLNMASISSSWAHRITGAFSAQLSHFKFVVHPGIFFQPGDFKSLNPLNLFCGQCTGTDVLHMILWSHISLEKVTYLE